MPDEVDAAKEEKPKKPKPKPKQVSTADPGQTLGTNFP